MHQLLLVTVLAQDLPSRIHLCELNDAVYDGKFLILQSFPLHCAQKALRLCSQKKSTCSKL